MVGERPATMVCASSDAPAGPLVSRLVVSPRLPQNSRIYVLPSAACCQAPITPALAGSNGQTTVWTFCQGVHALFPAIQLRIKAFPGVGLEPGRDPANLKLSKLLDPFMIRGQPIPSCVSDVPVYLLQRHSQYGRIPD